MNTEVIDYGVCRLSVVPVRNENADQSELVTQLLFGDDYEVLDYSKDRKWVYIRIHFDQYLGWIDARQHHSISFEYFDYISRAEYKITTDLTSSLLYNKSPLLILMGSVIPISSTELFKMEEQFAFNGESKSIGQKREFDFLKNIAFRYLNAPYLWGGKNPFGIDCSGFVQMVFKICGYRLYRDAWQQARQGKSVKSFEESQPGDIIFFKNVHDRIHHTGILLAEQKIIHASGRVRVDTVSEAGLLNVETGMVTHQYAHIRRMLA
jgi:gamma-D-glutamyl-L-lysine dipeptidyl-peptidase